MTDQNMLGDIHKPRGQLWVGVIHMTILLHKPCLLILSKSVHKGGGCQQYVHVVYGYPPM